MYWNKYFLICYQTQLEHYQSPEITPAVLAVVMAIHHLTKFVGNLSAKKMFQIISRTAEHQHRSKHQPVARNEPYPDNSAPTHNTK